MPERVPARTVDGFESPAGWAHAGECPGMAEAREQYERDELERHLAAIAAGAHDHELGDMRPDSLPEARAAVLERLRTLERLEAQS